MLKSAIFRTNKYEIHIEREKEDKWILSIYCIEHAVKELLEKQEVESYTTAYMYVELNYLERDKGKFV